VRRKRQAATLLALLALTCAAPARAQQGTAAAAGGHGRGATVSAVLAGLLASTQIDAATYHADFAAYVAAKRALSSLTGTRRAELGAALANVQAIAAAGELSASRLGEAFLTLTRNRELWTEQALPAPNQHVSFPGSELVWEYYPGQGVQIQWLATFGEGNGYYANHRNTQLRQLLAEAIPLAAQRAGGIAWEYMFQFDGGAPPWTSGLSQGTALQLLARAYSRLHEPAYLLAAQQALHLFQVPPPRGVALATPAGSLYVEYTFNPGDRILNGFIQALVGLYEYTSVTKDPLGEQLFEAGDAEARALVPSYDTGAWSLYDQFSESNLNYHELLTEFLAHLCERTRRGGPLSPGAALTQDTVYCSTAEAFTTDLRTPPALSLLSKTLRGATRAGVKISLSKVALVQLTITQGTRMVRRVAALLEHGDERLLWVTPSRGGTFTATLSATDLAGNVTSAQGTLVVSPRPARPGTRSHA